MRRCGKGEGSDETLGVPAQTELQRPLRAIVTRITRVLEKQRLLLRDDETYFLDLELADGFEPLLGAAVHDRIAVSPHTGPRRSPCAPSRLTHQRTPPTPLQALEWQHDSRQTSAPGLVSDPLVSMPILRQHRRAVGCFTYPPRSRRRREAAASMSCNASAFWIAASACAVLILSACGEESGTATPQRTNVLAPDASVRWPYSFVQAPFVHPRIVEDLSTWLSDVGDQVVAINLLDAQGSNRYYRSIDVNEIDYGCPYVYWESDGERGRFGYQYVGMTESRVHVLYTSSWGGGSGVFTNLMLLTITSDAGIDWNGQAMIRAGRERLLVNKLGQIGLSDRWTGDLRVAGNTLTIGPDRGWFSVSGGTGGGGREYERVLTIDVRRPGALNFGAPEYACSITSGVQQ